METKEKAREIQALAHYLCHLLKRRHMGYVGFETLKEKTGVAKDKAIDILNMLTDARLVDFEFDPWTPGKHSLEYYSPELLKTGYFTFVSKEIREQERKNAVARVRLYKDARANYQYIPEVERRMNELSNIANSEEASLNLINEFDANNKKISKVKSCEINGLVFNLVTGDMTYKDKKVSLPLNGQVFKALQILMTNEESMATYTDLISFIFNSLDVNFTKKSQLQKIISNLRNGLVQLGIDRKSIMQTKAGYRLKI